MTCEVMNISMDQIQLMKIDTKEIRIVSSDRLKRLHDNMTIIKRNSAEMETRDIMIELNKIFKCIVPAANIVDEELRIPKVINIILNYYAHYNVDVYERILNELNCNEKLTESLTAKVHKIHKDPNLQRLFAY